MCAVPALAVVLGEKPMLMLYVVAALRENVHQVVEQLVCGEPLSVTFQPAGSRCTRRTGWV